MLGKGHSSPKNVFKVTKGACGQKKCTKRDTDDDKRASMTMNEDEGSSHILLYGISQGLAETGLNIEEYVPQHM